MTAPLEADPQVATATSDVALPAPGRGRPRRVEHVVKYAVAALGTLYGLVSVGIVTALDSPLVSSYASTSDVASALTLTTGLALVVVGIVAWLTGFFGSTGLLVMLLGVVWFAPIWVGWQGPADEVSPLLPVGGAGPELARTIGMMLVPFGLPLLAHLVLSFPAGRVNGVAPRLVVGGAYIAGMLAAARVTIYDPFLDAACWSNCTDNSFLLRAEPELARRWLDSVLWVSIVGGVLVAGVAAWRLARTTRVGRRATWMILVPAGFAALTESAYARALLVESREDASVDPFATIFELRAFALGAIALGLAVAILRDVRRHSALTRLADDLGAAPPLGALRSALATSLGDPSLRVGYWMPDTERYVDSAGMPMDANPGSRQVATSIRRGGEPVAVVVHDRSVHEGQGLDQQIGAAATLAIDNERLGASLLARLDDLRRSRERLVEANDEARRRLERNLHDGAQQRLLVVVNELRMAQTAATREGRSVDAAELGAVIDDAKQVLADLRELAHGIFPSILDDGGLEPALWSLADRADVPVEVQSVPEERFDGAVERAAYLVVSKGVDSAADHARGVSVEVHRRDDRLDVLVEGTRSRDFVDVADRVGALGGRLTSDRDRLTAEIPCA